MTLNNEVFATHREEGRQFSKADIQNKSFEMRKSLVCTADKRSHAASGEEGAKDVKSGELGAVARLWEWPCVTSKGEGDIPWAIVLQIFWSDEDRLELCTLWKDWGTKWVSSLTFFIFWTVTYAEFAFCPRVNVWYDMTSNYLPFCKYCYSYFLAPGTKGDKHPVRYFKQGESYR